MIQTAVAVAAMYPHHRLFQLAVLLLSCILALPAQSQNETQPESEDRYLVLLSIDGFRWDYLDEYPTPALNRLAKRGVRADALLPVFPTLTFPNHYSVATGLYPQNHGLVANTFPNRDRSDWYVYKEAESAQDGSWYGGVPIWIAAHRAGMQTAAYFFPGSEADIQGIRPDRWYRYNKATPGSTRVRQVLKWLAEPPDTRPHMITLYFDDVDDHSHWSGVGSREAKRAISRVDRYVRDLVRGIDRLPHGKQVSIVVVSDHGQASYTHPQEALVADELFDISSFRPLEGGNYLFLYARKPNDAGNAEMVLQLQQAINERWSCGHAWRPEDAPPGWHVGNNPRFPELILMPDAGCAVASTRDSLKSLTPGDHGWAPENPDMHGIFIAAGPGIPAGLRIPALRNVDVYPLMLRQLGIEPEGKVDSDMALWPQLLDPDADPAIDSNL